VRVTDLAAQKTWSGTTYGDGRMAFYPRIAGRGAPSSSYAVEASFGGMTVRSAWDGKSDLELKFDADRSVKGAIQLDVVFVLDTTGSMGDEIDRIKGTLVSVTDRLRGLRQEFSLRYGAMLYKDRGDAYVTREIPFTGDIHRSPASCRASTPAAAATCPRASTRRSTTRSPWPGARSRQGHVPHRRRLAAHGLRRTPPTARPRASRCRRASASTRSPPAASSPGHARVAPGGAADARQVHLHRVRQRRGQRRQARRRRRLQEQQPRRHHLRADPRRGRPLGKDATPPQNVADGSASQPYEGPIRLHKRTP
jgi:hypothetical protein